MTRFMVEAGDKPLLVVFEPWASEYTLLPGDHLIVEWPDRPEGGLLGGITCSSSGITISEPSGGPTRIWNSAGEELPIWG